MKANSTAGEALKKLNTAKVKAAQHLLEKERQERAENAKVALEAWMKEYNVELQPVVTLGTTPVPLSAILVLPVGLNIVVK